MFASSDGASQAVRRAAAAGASAIGAGAFGVAEGGRGTTRKASPVSSVRKNISRPLMASTSCWSRLNCGSASRARRLRMSRAIVSRAGTLASSSTENRLRVASRPSFWISGR